MSARHLVAEGEGKIRKGNKKPKKTDLQNTNTQPSKAQTQLSKLVGVDRKVLKESARDGQALVTLISLKTSNLSREKQQPQGPQGREMWRAV